MFVLPQWIVIKQLLLVTAEGARAPAVVCSPGYRHLVKFAEKIKTINLNRSFDGSPAIVPSPQTANI